MATPPRRTSSTRRSELANQPTKGLKTLIEFAGRTPLQFDLVIGQSVSPALCEGFPT